MKGSTVRVRPAAWLTAATQHVAALGGMSGRPSPPSVVTGAMTLGPQGAFKPVAGVVKGTMGRRKLDVYPVEERDGVLYLAD
jgi:hypothetical protein